MNASIAPEVSTSLLAELLPEATKIMRGNTGLQYFLGNGKDGYVYQMFNPRDPDDRSFDRLAVKIWTPEFNRRQTEIDLHQAVLNSDPSYFQTPGIVHVDFGLGAFVMDKVYGKTTYRSLFTSRRFLSRSLYDTIIIAFRELGSMDIVHNDAHVGNYMLSECEILPGPHGEVVIDAEVWIIDFGRSVIGSSTKDIVRIEQDIKHKIISGF